MILEKQRRMVNLLLAKTKVGGLEWIPAIGDDSFQVSFRDNSVRLTQVQVRDQTGPDYLVELINEDGAVVESFTDRDLYADQEELPRNERVIYFEVLRQLFELARRTALGSEKVLNSILDELDDDEIPF